MIFCSSIFTFFSSFGNVPPNFNNFPKFFLINHADNILLQLSQQIRFMTVTMIIFSSRDASSSTGFSSSCNVYPNFPFFSNFPFWTMISIIKILIMISLIKNFIILITIPIFIISSLRSKSSRNGKSSFCNVYLNFPSFFAFLIQTQIILMSHDNDVNNPIIMKL